MLYFGFQKLEIAFELGYLKKDVFENISEKAKKLSRRHLLFRQHV